MSAASLRFIARQFEKLEGCRVKPVQILDRDDKRFGLRQSSELIEQRLKCCLFQLGRRQVGVALSERKQRGKHGKNPFPCEFIADYDAVKLAEPNRSIVVLGDPGGLPEPEFYSIERAVHVERRCRKVLQDNVGTTYLHQKMLKQARFADPRLPVNHHGPASPGERLPPACAELLDLLFTIDHAGHLSKRTARHEAADQWTLFPDKPSTRGLRKAL
jgi:hypothetical protein